MAVASIPIPAVLPQGLHGRLRWHPGIPRERLAGCCGYGCHQCVVPLSPSGLVRAWLCSDELTGTVNIKKRLDFGNSFCGRVVATSTISLLRLAAFSGKCDASSSAPKSPDPNGHIPCQGSCPLWLQTARPFSRTFSARIWPPRWSPKPGVFRLWSVQPRAGAPLCLPTTSSSSPLAACLDGQGHLKATAGQTVTSLPCHELASLGALVPMASSAQPSIPNGRQVLLGKEVLWCKGTWDMLLAGC